MGRIDDYEFKAKDQQLSDFKDDLLDLINHSKFQFSISEGAIPAWNANEGEFALYQNGSDRRLYVRFNSAWVQLASSTTSGGAAPGSPEGAVQFNSSNAFGGNAGFIFSLTTRHVAIGSTAVVDRGFSGLNIDNFTMNFEQEILNATQANSDGNIDLIAIRGTIIATNTSNTSSTGMMGIFAEANIPVSNSTDWDGRIFGIISRVNHAGGGTVDRIYGVRGTVLASNANELIGIAARVFSSDIATGSKSRIAVHADANNSENTDSIPTSGKFGLYIARHSRGSIGDATRVANIYSEESINANPYKDSINHFGGVITAGPFGSSYNDRGSIVLRNDNFTHSFGGSGAIILSGGIATVTGSGTNFLLDLIPSVSIDFLPTLAYAGTVISSNGEYVVVSSVNSLTSLTLANNATTTTSANGAEFTVRRANLYLSGNGPLTSYIPSYIFVVCQGLGRVGINVHDPSEDLDVRGNVRVRGNLLIGGAAITSGNTTSVKQSGVIFTTTASGVASNNASEITLIRGIIGTTSLVANTLSEGRSIRLSAFGYFNTPLVADNLTMRVKLGGVTVLTTDAQAPATSASSLGWKLDTIITCLTTGGAGTVIGQGDSEFHSSLVAKSFWQMVNSAPVVINTTGNNVLEITAQWAGASSASQLFMTNCCGELLN